MDFFAKRMDLADYFDCSFVSKEEYRQYGTCLFSLTGFLGLLALRDDLEAPQLATEASSTEVAVGPDRVLYFSRSCDGIASLDGPLVYRGRLSKVDGERTYRASRYESVWP
jgi:hypothetical protein